MKQTIKVNGINVLVKTHPNCPIIMNIGHNTHYRKMRYLAIGDDKSLAYCEGQGYHVVSDKEFIETYVEHLDYPISDIKADFYDFTSDDRHKPLYVHMLDAYELLIERFEMLSI